jgi:molecular chaperone DnaK (HSP70)
VQLLGQKSEFVFFTPGVIMRENRDEADNFALTQYKEFTLAGDASSMVDEAGYLREALGLESQGGLFSTLLLSGCGVPCSASYGFTTSIDNQKRLAIKLFRGTSNFTAEDIHIGDFEVVSIPPSPKGEILIDIRFSITSEKNLMLSARVKATGALLPIKPTILPETAPPPLEPKGTWGILDYPIGIVTVGESFSELISSGARLPQLHSDTFANALDNQTSVYIELVQRRPEGVEQIAVITVSDIPPAPKGVLQITITISVNREKELRVKATIPEKNYVREFGPFPVQ